MDADNLLTVSEVADKLRVGIDCVYRLIKSRKLTAVKLGNRYRIRTADYQAFITPKPVATQTPRSQRERIKQMLRSV